MATGALGEIRRVTHGAKTDPGSGTAGGTTTGSKGAGSTSSTGGTTTDSKGAGSTSSTGGTTAGVATVAHSCGQYACTPGAPGEICQSERYNCPADTLFRLHDDVWYLIANTSTCCKP